MEEFQNDSRTSTAASSLARKFDFLQERAQRRPIREASLDLSTGDAGSKKANISQLKEFYLNRLAKNEPGVAARLGAQMQKTTPGRLDQPQASGQSVARPTFPTMAPATATRDIEDLEIMCNNCFNLIKSSEAGNCTGDPAACPVALRAGSGEGTAKPSGLIQVLDLKLQKLRAALEARLQDASSKVNVMRQLTQLRYHIDAAAKWVPGCSEIGALSQYTVQQVKQLTSTSRHLAPAVYIFSKRIENVVVQKERELRKVMVQVSGGKSFGGSGYDGLNIDIDRDALGGDANSTTDVNSVVSELDSDTGTQCQAETIVTHDGHPPGTGDVGNVNDANEYISEYLSLKNEDEQRRWFYSECLKVKLACPDKARARKTLISDLYAKVREDGVPIEKWVECMRQQLMPEEANAAGASQQEPTPLMQRTTPMPSFGSGLGGAARQGGFNPDSRDRMAGYGMDRTR